ncbi:prolyl hydroxylase family protein [Pseudomonas sp. CGJS7]|uniref:prolyl hydroxylase family protein n=1 Tax=Pseudomonas sp. CGJS7 TaxID=3109348 RepID=UPI003009E293
MRSAVSERNFIAFLLEQGFSTDKVREELISMGWYPQNASLALQRWADGIVEDEVSAPCPGPDLSQMPSRLEAGDRQVVVLLRMHRPKMCLLGDFIAAEECAELIELSKPRMRRSQVVVGDGSANEVGTIAYARTSDQTFIERGSSELVDRLRDRAAEVMGWPAAQMEDLQIVRYRPGADFSAHRDYFCEKAHADLIERQGQRVGTLLFYLNTPPRGGATALLDVELEIYPQQGNALFFGYPQASEESMTLHMGVPLGEGEKWIATFFLIDRVPKKLGQSSDDGSV